MRTWTVIETLRMDLAYGLRQLRRNPGFAAVAILTLVLGFGANTAIFSVVNAVLLKPLPFSDPERLVEARETEAAPGTYPIDPADYLDWQARNHTFEATTAFSWTGNRSMAGSNEPAAAAVTEVQASFFKLLGITPMAGRSFAKGEDVAGRNRIALLSYSFWQQHFGGNAGAIGKMVELDAEKYILIGVMPPAFHFPGTTEVWVPFDMKGKTFTTRGTHGYNVIGKMKRGVTLEQVRQDLLSISLRWKSSSRTSMPKSTLCSFR